MEEITPFEVLDIWDFVTVCLSVGLRFLVDLSVHVEKKDIKYYFGKSSVRLQWTIHLVAVFVLMITLPTWVVSANHGVKYLTNWQYLGTLVVGLGGFDVIRLLFWLGKRVIKKKA